MFTNNTFPCILHQGHKLWGGGPCDYCDSLSPKFWIWDFGLIYRNQTSDSGLQASDLGLIMINERRLFRVWTNESRVLTSPLPVAHLLLQDSVPKVTRNLKSNSPNFFLGVFRSLISGNINELILHCQVQGSLRL